MSTTTVQRSFEVERYSFVRYPPGTTKEEEKRMQWTHNNSLNDARLVFESIYQKGQHGRPLSCMLKFVWGADTTEKCSVTASLGIVARSPSIAIRYFSASTNMTHRFQIRFRNPADLHAVENIVRDFGCPVKPAGYIAEQTPSGPSTYQLRPPSAAPSMSYRQPQNLYSDGFEQTPPTLLSSRPQPRDELEPIRRTSSRPDTSRAWDRGIPADLSRDSVLPPLRKPTPLMKIAASADFYNLSRSPASPAIPSSEGSSSKRFADTQAEDTASRKCRKVASRLAPASNQASQDTEKVMELLQQHQESQRESGMSPELQIYQPRAVPYAVNRDPPWSNPEACVLQTPQVSDSARSMAYDSDALGNHLPNSFQKALYQQIPIDQNVQYPAVGRPAMSQRASDPHLLTSHQHQTYYRQEQYPLTLPTPPPSSSPRTTFRYPPPPTSTIQPGPYPLQTPLSIPAVETELQAPPTTAAIAQAAESIVVPSNVPQKDLERQIVELIHDDSFLQLLQQVEGIWQRVGFSLNPRGP